MTRESPDSVGVPAPAGHTQLERDKDEYQRDADANPGCSADNGLAGRPFVYCDIELLTLGK